MVSKYPFNGKTNVLATSFDSRMNELNKQQRDLLRSTARDEGAMLTNRALKRRSKEAVRQSLIKSIGNYRRSDIKDIYPKVPEESVEKPFVMKRNSLLSGKLADAYLDKNFTQIKKYIDTLTDRDINSIAQEVSDKFKVYKIRIKKYIADNPEVFNRNK